jgi:hypothetical protein
MYLRAVKPFYIKEICHIYRYSGTVFGQNQRPTFSTMLSLDTRASAIAKLTSSGGPFTWEEVSCLLMYFLETMNVEFPPTFLRCPVCILLVPNICYEGPIWTQCNQKNISIH